MNLTTGRCEKHGNCWGSMGFMQRFFGLLANYQLYSLSAESQLILERLLRLHAPCRSLSIRDSSGYVFSRTSKSSTMNSCAALRGWGNVRSQASFLYPWKPINEPTKDVPIPAVWDVLKKEHLSFAAATFVPSEDQILAAREEILGCGQVWNPTWETLVRC